MIYSVKEVEYTPLFVFLFKKRGVYLIKFKKNKEENEEVKVIQYTKKLVTLIMISTFLLSCFGTYINYKNGYSLDAVVLKWIDFAIWIGGIYLAKAFAETYSAEKNNLKRDLISYPIGQINNMNTVKSESTEEEVEI